MSIQFNLDFNTEVPRRTAPTTENQHRETAKRADAVETHPTDEVLPIEEILTVEKHLTSGGEQDPEEETPAGREEAKEEGRQGAQATTPPPCIVPPPVEGDTDISLDDVGKGDFGGSSDTRRSEISVPGEYRIKDLGEEGGVYTPDVRRLSRRVSQRITGSRRFYDLMTTLYPATYDEPGFARVLLALLSPNRVGTSADGDAEVLLDGQTLAACMGRERDYAEGNLTGDEATGAFLHAFRDIVLPNLEWTEYEPGQRARAVALAHVRDLLDPHLLRLWNAEMETPAHKLEDRVYLDTGEAFGSVSRSRERKRAREQMEGYAALAPTPLTGRVYALMDSVPTRAFSPLLDRLDAARIAAEGLGKERARRDALKALDRIADEPIQRYGFTPYSARIFGTNPGVATVATPVRRALLPDCYEVDLAGSQLAVAAVELGCPTLYDFLDAGKSFWAEIVEHIGVPFDAASKAAVKRGTYGLVYGAGDARIVSDVRDEYAALTGAQMDAGQAARFLTHPLVREVLEVRDAELERIRERGYVVDVFGRRLVQGQMEYGDGIKRTVSGADAARSLLAQKAQARELWLLEPLIELAEREAERTRPKWRVLCWQHDGCSIRFDGRAELHLGRLEEAVAERAERYGYPTRLEVKCAPE